MISYDEALKSIYNNSVQLDSQLVKVIDSLGFVCDEDLASPENVPSFNNSAMDGFAVKSDVVREASEHNPVVLYVEGSTAAGDALNKGSTGIGAWEIMTGGPVPEAYDSVIKIEDIEILEQDNNDRPQKISIKTSSYIKQNIRNSGEDFKIGDVVIKAGEIIYPQHIMALSSLGISDIKVKKKPNISVISTGLELVDDLSVPLKSGQIRNSNAPYILSELSAMNIEANYAGTIHDDVEKFEETISELLEGESNIIISTGAVSMGRYDFIPDSLRKLGAEILFHKVAIRPGKPVLFAKFNIGKDSNIKYYFGLPGNPVSAAVGLRFFTYPLIRNLLNLPEEIAFNATISSRETKKQGFRFFRKAYLHSDSNGSLIVDILNGQESFKISPLLKANCWAMMPDNKTKIDEGELLQIYPLNPVNINIGVDNYENKNSLIRSIS